MEQTTLAVALAFITAVVALATGVAAFMSALISYNAKKEIEKARRIAETTDEKVEQVHHLVNRWRDEMDARVNQLTALLKKSDVEIPAPLPKIDSGS